MTADRTHVLAPGEARTTAISASRSRARSAAQRRTATDAGESSTPTAIRPPVSLDMASPHVQSHRHANVPKGVLHPDCLLLLPGTTTPPMASLLKTIFGTYKVRRSAVAPAAAPNEPVRCCGRTAASSSAKTQRATAPRPKDVILTHRQVIHRQRIRQPGQRVGRISAGAWLRAFRSPGPMPARESSALTKRAASACMWRPCGDRRAIHLAGVAHVLHGKL